MLLAVLVYIMLIHVHEVVKGQFCIMDTVKAEMSPLHNVGLWIQALPKLAVENPHLYTGSDSFVKTTLIYKSSHKH